MKNLNKKKKIILGVVLIVIILLIILLITFIKHNNIYTSKTITCTKSMVDENNYIIENQILITSDKKKIITKVESTNIENSREDYADYLYSYRVVLTNELNNIKGISAENLKVSDTMTKFKVTVDYTLFDKKDLKDISKDSIYDLKDMKVKDYINKYLKDYTCK